MSKIFQLAFYLLFKNLLLTARQTDMMAYRAAIAAKNQIKLKTCYHIPHMDICG